MNRRTLLKLIPAGVAAFFGLKVAGDEPELDTGGFKDFNEWAHAVHKDLCERDPRLVPNCPDCHRPLRTWRHHWSRPNGVHGFEHDYCAFCDPHPRTAYIPCDGCGNMIQRPLKSDCKLKSRWFMVMCGCGNRIQFAYDELRDEDLLSSIRYF